MAATIKRVSKEHMEILREYLSEPGIILVTDEMAEVYKKETGLELADGDDLDVYDFGGEPDHYVDVVSSKSAFIFSPVGKGQVRESQGMDTEE